jgi:Domain of unknown function (DUF4258)
MKVRIHPHARQRMWERGATTEDIRQTIASGRVIPAKFGRTRFRRVFTFDSVWNGKKYARRQIDAYAVKITDGWLVITVIVKYF